MLCVQAGSSLRGARSFKSSALAEPVFKQGGRVCVGGALGSRARKVQEQPYRVSSGGAQALR